MEISHEEFITILNEKDKHEKIKEGIRTIKSSGEGKKNKTTELQMNYTSWKMCKFRLKITDCNC